MRKKEKKIVDYAEATRKRIIVYSNSDTDDYHLVAENQEGDINIFFEKENIYYSKESSSSFRSKEKVKVIQYFLICNYIYILWLFTNNVAFGNLIQIKEEMGILIFLNIILFFAFSIPMLKNKYIKQFIFILLVSIIIDNILINFAFNFVDYIILGFKILLIIALIPILFIMLCEYIMFFMDERKKVEERGKHSAEHMMCNYIEKYQTYPKSVKELKKASRFSLECGGLYGDFAFEEGMALFISNIIVMLASINILENFDIISKMIVYNKTELIISTIFLVEIFIIISFAIDILQFPIYSILIIFSQIINTLPKRKLKYKDLKMAQMLSKKFFEWQYPNDIEPKQEN